MNDIAENSKRLENVSYTRIKVIAWCKLNQTGGSGQPFLLEQSMVIIYKSDFKCGRDQLGKCHTPRLNPFHSVMSSCPTYVERFSCVVNNLA